MKKHLLLLLGVLLALPAAARDFAYTYEGQTITYTVIDEEAKTVSTKAGEYWDNPGNNVSGALILPSVVLDGEAEYTLTEIGNCAFWDCSGLTSVTIPNSVTSIGSSAFSSCSGLTSATIPNSVTSIGNSAFFACSSLTSIEIPNSVTSIGDQAFQYCSGLTSVDIPNSVTSIGHEAFSGCFGLTSVVIPNSVTSIGNSAFFECRGLTSVVIGNSVTYIGEDAFFGCFSLTSITVEAGNTAYASLDGVLFNKDLSTLIQFPGGCTGNYSIPNSVTYIGDRAFYKCIGLTSVEIPNSVTSIGRAAFVGCGYLTSVHITDIAAWCRIGFEEESSNPLSYAHNLYLNGDKVENLVIPNSINSVKNYAFYACDGLITVTIPNSVTSIGDRAFQYCFGLTGELIIPNSVTSIGEYAFLSCHRLTSVVISNSVTSIGSYAFAICSGLTSVYYGADKPIAGNSNIFSSSIVDSSTYEKATLYTTEIGALMAAKVDPWKNFKNIEVYDFAGIDEIVADKVAAGDIDYDAPYEVYNLNGVNVGSSIDGLAPGLYIVRQGGKVKKLKIQNS